MYQQNWLSEILVLSIFLLVSGCATQGTSAQAVSIPSDMKLLTCQSKSMGAIMVQIDIPGQFDSKWINAIRQSAVSYGQQKCSNRGTPTIVIMNGPGVPKGRIVASTQDGGINWTNVRTEIIEEQAGEAPQVVAQANPTVSQPKSSVFVKVPYGDSQDDQSTDSSYNLQRYTYVGGGRHPC